MSTRDAPSSAHPAEDDWTHVVPKEERDRVLARIEYLQVILLEARTDDGRALVQQALADGEKRLRELDAASGGASA